MNLKLTLGMVLCSMVLLAQTKVYFTPGTMYLYNAHYIDENNDTISNEMVKMEVTDSVMNYNQLMVKYYFENHQLPVKSYIDSITGIDQKWVTKQGEGAIETKYNLWIHPIRSNQYILTEIAPFPQIMLPPDDGMKWKTVTYIPDQWQNLRGKVKSHYQTSLASEISYRDKIISCTLVSAKGKHSRLGKSTLLMYFHNELGIVRMHYVFFNGDQIVFELESREN